MPIGEEDKPGGTPEKRGLMLDVEEFFGEGKRNEEKMNGDGRDEN